MKIIYKTPDRKKFIKESVTDFWIKRLQELEERIKEYKRIREIQYEIIEYQKEEIERLKALVSYSNLEIKKVNEK